MEGGIRQRRGDRPKGFVTSHDATTSSPLQNLKAKGLPHHSEGLRRSRYPGTRETHPIFEDEPQRGSASGLGWDAPHAKPMRHPFIAVAFGVVGRDDPVVSPTTNFLHATGTGTEIAIAILHPI